MSALFLLSWTVQVSATDYEVDQDDVNFSPESLTIKNGDVVHFRNSATMNHNVSVIDADGGADDLGIEKPGAVFARKFDKTGDYKVRCTVHPKMKMTITVQ